GRNGAAEPLAEIIGDAGRNFAALVELQLQLLSEDFKQAARDMLAPVWAGAVMAVLGLSSAVVLMLGIAELLMAYTTLMRGWAYVIVAAVGLVIGAALLSNAMRIARQAPKAFERSKQELLNNIQALNTIWQRPTAPQQSDRVQ